MKNLSFLLFVIFTLNTSIFAQRYTNDDFDQKKINSGYGKIIKISPLLFFYGNLPLTGEYGFSVEQKTGLKSAFQGDIAYVGNGLIYLMAYASDTTNTVGMERITMMGFRAQAAMRFYIGKKYASEGWYIAPQISFARCKYSSSSAKQSDSYLQGTHIDYGTVFGYQIVAGRFVLDFGLGVAYRQKLWAEKNYKTIQALSDTDVADLYIIPGDIRPKLVFSLGRAF